MFKRLFGVTVLSACILGGCAGYVNEYKEYPQVRQLFDNFQAPGDSGPGATSGDSGGNGCAR